MLIYLENEYFLSGKGSNARSAGRAIAFGPWGRGAIHVYLGRVAIYPVSDIS